MLRTWNTKGVAGKISGSCFSLSEASSSSSSGGEEEGPSAGVFSAAHEVLGRLSRNSVRVSVLALACTSVGCGPTRGEVIDQYRGRFNELRRTLRALAESLPDPEAVPPETIAAKLDPALVYADKGASNTAIFSYANLTANADPPLKDASGERDLGLAGDLLHGLKWTGPKNPMGRTALKGRDEKFAEKLEAALACRYLVIYRMTERQRPRVAPGGETFKAGVERYVGYVIDLPSKEVKTTLRFSARSSSRVQYSSKKGEGKTGRAQAFVDSDLWEQLRASLREELKDATGGTLHW